MVAIKNIFGTAWFLFLCAAGAAWMGWIDVPRPVVAAWESLNGNSADEFDALTQQYPANQAQFVAAVLKHREDYRSASNDMAKGATRPSRKKAICATVGEFTDGEWVGIVSDLSSNGDGKGALSVKIAPHTLLKTWNNSLSDIGSGTLIEPGTRLHDSAVGLVKGQRVRFTAKFFPDDTDCIEEASMSLGGSMSDPEFIVRFHSIGGL